MSLSSFCIKQPVFTWVISAVILLLGVLGLSQLELRSTPKVFRPTLHVYVSVPGASSEFIEENVVMPLEDALQGTQDLSYLHSESDEGSGQVDLYFKNISQEQFVMDQASVQQSISSTSLPDNALPPVIQFSQRNSNQLMIVAISSDRMDQHHLVDYVHNNIFRVLQQVPGVGSVQQWSTQAALRIQLLPERLAALGITVAQVKQALNDNDVSFSAGQIVNDQQEIPINLNSRPTSIRDFEHIPIVKQQDRLITLGDVASVVIGNSDLAGAYTLYREKEGAALSIQAADTANPIALGDALRKTIAQMQINFPPGMELHMIADMSKDIKHSVLEVFWTIAESICLVAFITFLFLGRLRFALIPLVTIPICIIGAFAGMWLLGYSINMVTLLALVVAVGLVVDDAIVVLENTHRQMELGIPAREATITGMQQIMFSVVGMTISVIAVYIPVAFMSGKGAVYFQQFSFTLAGAVLISGIVALTLTPMMCASLLTSVKHHGYDAFLERVFSSLKAGYIVLLTWVIRLRLWVIAIFFIFLAGGVLVFSHLPSSLLPVEYGGFIFLSVNAPTSSSVTNTKKIHESVIKKLIELPDIGPMMSFGGGDGSDNFGLTFLSLKEPYRTYGATVAYVDKLNAMLHDFSPYASIGAGAMNVGLDNDNGGGNNPGAMEFYVTGFADYRTISTVTTELVAALKPSGIFVDVSNGMTYSNQEYNITIDHNEAMQLGVPLGDVLQSISSLLGSYRIQNGYQFNGIDYPVIMQLSLSDLHDLSVLQRVFVESSNGIHIPLSRLVKITPSIDLPARVHMNGARAGIFNVVATPTATPGQVLAVVQQTANAVLPSGFSIAYPMSVQRMIEGQNTMTWIFFMGLVFIYLVLAALFESFIDPLIILLTVPLCIIGALLVLYLMGGNLNIYTGIALVTLIGLIAKHGVLIVRFANELRAQGKSVREAVIEGASIRLRPILMTTCTMTLGALPLLFVSGVGSNARSQLGAVIISGLVVGTVFSLLVVPVAYTIFARFKRTP